MCTIEYPDLPESWEWWSGNRSGAYYTRWFGTEHAEHGYNGVIYSDDRQRHIVHIYPIRGIRDDGDPDVAEYPDTNTTYDTEEAAVNAVPDLIRNLE